MTGKAVPDLVSFSCRRGISAEKVFRGQFVGLIVVLDVVLE